MRRISRRRARVGVVILTSAALGLAPGFVAAQYQSGSDQASSESKPPGQGGSEPAKNGQKSGQNNAGKGPSAGEVGDRLHDSAKNFGEALLGSIKYAGRKVITFFTGEK